MLHEKQSKWTVYVAQREDYRRNWIMIFEDPVFLKSCGSKTRDTGFDDGADPEVVRRDVQEQFPQYDVELQDMDEGGRLYDLGSRGFTTRGGNLLDTET